MLPARHRMRRSTDFAAVLRHGTRHRHGAVVFHLLRGAQAEGDDGGAPTVGLIVGRSVGGSVVRHRVSRRLRAQLARRVAMLPAGSRSVVRALPEAAQAQSAGLGADLDAAMARALRAPARRSPAGTGERR